MGLTLLGDTLQNKKNSNSSFKKQLEGVFIIEIVQNVLEEIFGSDISKEIKPLFVKNRTLTLSCSNSAVAQEIRINQSIIVEKINEKIGKKEIDRIRYLV